MGTRRYWYSLPHQKIVRDFEDSITEPPPVPEKPFLVEVERVFRVPYTDKYHNLYFNQEREVYMSLELRAPQKR